jgi:phage-related protein
MEWAIEYYNESVQESISQWPVGIRAYYARITERIIIHGPNLGMPFTKSFGGGLFEIWAIGKEGIGRAFFCACIGHKIVILHGFIKKTNKTLLKEIALAKRRLQEVIHDNPKNT